MKTILAAGVALLSFATAAAGLKTTSTWSSPEHAQRTYARVIALAKISEDQNKRLVEDELVASFGKQKVAAVPAYAHLKPEDMATADAAKKRAEELGVDAALVVTVVEKGTQVKAGPTVSAGVGVPVHVGMFSVFVGTSVPLGGKPKTVEAFILKAEFFEMGAGHPIWSATYAGDLAAGPEAAAKDLARQAIKQLRKAKILK